MLDTLFPKFLQGNTIPCPLQRWVLRGNKGLLLVLFSLGLCSPTYRVAFRVVSDADSLQARLIIKHLLLSALFHGLWLISHYAKI